jgi:glycosyltransferase involved in cell wall biosynthesis
MRRKILHIITKLELGGAQQNTIYTVKNLDRKKFATGLISGPGGILNSEAEAIEEAEFLIAENLRRSINPLAEIKALSELRKLIREFSPDVVHTHSSKAGVLGRLAAAKEKVPVIIHSIHGFGIDADSNPLIRNILIAAEKMAARKTTHFISVSQVNIDEGLEIGLFTPDQVSLIHSGVKLASFRQAEYSPQLRQELGIPPEAKVVGSIACFKPQKDPLAFVRVAAMVKKEIPAAHFLMVGDGELRQQVEAEIASLSLADSFTLTGWRRDIPQLLKQCQLSVLTSRWEGLPRVISESLSAKVPVVVTRAGGSAEAVKQGETGYVVEHGQWQKMADHIIEILSDSTKRQAMAQAGPDSVLEWDIDEMVSAQEHLYEELLKDKT